MKLLIPIFIGLLVVGCGKGNQTANGSPKETPVKEITKEDVVGTYEFNNGENTYRYVFLENGVVKFYANGKKEEAGDKWKFVDGELHAVEKDRVTAVFRINKDGSITWIARIDKDGIRTDVPQRLLPYKKIK